MTDQGKLAQPFRARFRSGDVSAVGLPPFHPLDARELYDLLSTRALTEQGLYLNLGYWEDARTSTRPVPRWPSARRSGGDGAGDDVVDVGFGFAEQDMLWIERFAPRHITGLNVTASQVRIARERVRKRGLPIGSTCAKARPRPCRWRRRHATSSPRWNAHSTSTPASAFSPRPSVFSVPAAAWCSRT